MFAKQVAAMRASIRAEITRLQELDESLAKLESSDGAPKGKGKNAGTRRLSAAGRAAISRAAKKRWAAHRAKKKA